MDPRDIFGRVPFAGTGMVEDYFPPPMDLSYLRQEGVGYDPGLDPPALIAQGVPPVVAQQAQGVRMRMLQQAGQKKALQDEQGALQALSRIDPSKETFAKDLLGILQKYPSAHQSPNFTSQLKMVGEFARMMPTKDGDEIFDPDEIKDPDIYQQAITEGWDKLPSKAGKRRAYDAMARKERRLKLISEGGLTPQQVDDLEKSSGLSEEQIVHALSQAKGQRPEKNLTHEQSRFMAETKAKAAKLRQALSSDEGKLEYLRAKFSPDDPKRTEFTKEQWDEAYEAAMQPNIHDAEVLDYMKSIGMTPSQLTETVQETVTEDIPQITTQEQYDALPVGAPYLTPDGKRATKKK